MSGQELEFIVSKLQIVMQNDNQARKEAEASLQQVRTQDPDKYAHCIIQIVNSTEVGVDVRSLALVIFRRNISSLINEEKDVADSQCIWKIIKKETRTLISQATLQMVENSCEKVLMHKVCNFAVEVAGTLNDVESQVWNDLLQLCHKLFQSGVEYKIEMSLHIFNGLFSFIVDDLYEHINSFRDIFA